MTHGSAVRLASVADTLLTALRGPCFDICHHSYLPNAFIVVTIPVLKCIDMFHSADTWQCISALGLGHVLLSGPFFTTGWSHSFESSENFTRRFSCIDMHPQVSFQITLVVILSWSHSLKYCIALRRESYKVLSCIDIHHHVSSMTIQ